MEGTSVDIQAIPEQERIPWSIALAVSWAGLRRRVLRSLITMLGIVLGIAFLTHMFVTGALTDALIAVNDDALNVLLQKAGVDVLAAGKTDSMMILLIGLSLFTCLVGIINSMLMSVSERIREIGTMKCLGAVDGFIVRAYFIESTLQGVAGTVAGIVIGLIVAVSVSLVSYGRYVWLCFPVLGVLKSIGIAFVTGALISIVASIAPAYWAAKKEPVDAMRIEE
jgi:ABC-type antimicrobial peptide transport system permease subunit